MANIDFFAADNAWPLWDDQFFEGAFEFSSKSGIEAAVVHSVERPWLFHYNPTTTPLNRAILILGGGGYVELMVGREGYQVAMWLTSLGFDTFVLIHRFPNAQSTPQAPVDDARKALNIITEGGFAPRGLGICGLSSGGHLGAALLAEYPETWSSPDGSAVIPKVDFAIIGYGPISTNAKGRTIVPDKAALPPKEKQELYDVVQPDVQIKTAPPTFIVYSGSDSVVPVINAYRLAEGITTAGAKVELHVFADAPHGFALDTVGLPVSRWPGLCEAWMEQNGLLTA
ncbi:hypothetical protein B5807_06640 [Epicoccum nigrum]|uniref:BD-FAE-like domain-containing protein n=1 Tax=Epicoccum nigrum TaxID=105696 RepID=A0A1Y2LW24_EPING|nr:hypothetical protein B5807_06640 [Epicoccum nigrum]